MGFYKLFSLSAIRTNYMAMHGLPTIMLVFLKKKGKFYSQFSHFYAQLNDIVLSLTEVNFTQSLLSQIIIYVFVPLTNIIYFSNVQLLVQWYFFLYPSDLKRISRNIFESNRSTVYKKNKEGTLVICLKAWAGNVIVKFRELFCSTKCDFDLYKRVALLCEH